MQNSGPVDQRALRCTGMAGAVIEQVNAELRHCFGFRAASVQDR
jgi:hypothetical protein